MLDIRTITDNKQWIYQNHDVILPLSVTWNANADETLNDDGSFTEGSDTSTTIRAQIEPIESINQEQYKRIQVLAEETTHVLFILDLYSINEEDKIVYSGKTYRVVYVFVEQYTLGLTECLLRVEG